MGLQQFVTELAALHARAKKGQLTPAERADPKIIDGSRKLRIATGSGVTTSEVNALLKQFGEMQKMMKGLGGGMLGRAGKRKKGKGGPGGGRTTPKGGKPKFTLPDPNTPIDPKKPFTLPGL